MIRIEKTTLPLLHEYYREFQMDPDLFMDMSLFKEYVYTPERVEAYWNKISSRKDSVNFVILSDEVPVGEVGLKHIDPEKRECELTIHLKNDSVKNKGFGTEAERLMLRYAFSELNMDRVLADAVLKNKRSQHVLEKVGFRKTGEDETFVYYVYERPDSDAI